MLGVCGGGDCGGCWDGSVLFDLVDAAAGADLGRFVSMVCVRMNATRLTTPINSYNMAGVFMVPICAPFVRCSKD